MLTIKVHIEEESYWYVLKKDLHESIGNEYRNDEAQIEKISKAYGEMISGSTVPVLQREPLIIGIYPWDLAVIFKRLSIPVQFIDEKGESLNVNIGMSGISDWI